MPTKDPHIAFIDAQEELHQIKLRVKAAVARVRQMASNNLPLSLEDQHMIAAIRQEAIDATRRVQDRLYEELESHGKT